MKKTDNISKEQIELSSLGDPEFVELVKELQRFLRSKLIPCPNDQGKVYNWSCGVDHFIHPSSWNRYKYTEKFCKKKNIDLIELIDRISNYFNIGSHCECLIATDISMEDYQSGVK